ncbi:MerR family transcriptional regulator [Rossellomorea aquimaris]|uniref:MerR family transcriptional regulator n=1 Tax=Rossellomorea aquimaris TaxID=189382 RepID=UPI0007D06B14|nr:MerR family transcriptional regulator [Rossellomorea aquimaris]
MYSIGEVADLFGISVHTLRYYEQENILSPLRNHNGKRMYDESQIKWLRFVLKLKETQMPIAQIKEYTKFVKQGEETTSERISLLENHQKMIQQQIDTLLATNEMLEKKITGYKIWLKGKNS